MSIIKRNGSGMTNLFDDFFSRDLFNWGAENYAGSNTTMPAVNIKEDKENFTVEMAAPGMQKNDFNIQLDGNNLTINCERSNEDQQNADTHFTRREFQYQSFQRSFTLSKDVVDIDQIQARYENGILTLVIPKKEEAKQKPPRMIEVA